jgi:hypothetical protein
MTTRSTFGSTTITGDVPPLGCAGASAATGADGEELSPVAAAAAAGASGCCTVPEELDVVTVSSLLEQAARAIAPIRVTESAIIHFCPNLLNMNSPL